MVAPWLHLVLAPLIGRSAIYLLAYPAVVLAAWVGGLPAAAVAGAVLAVLSPTVLGASWDGAGMVRAVLFFGMALAIGMLSNAMLRTRARLAERAAVVDTLGRRLSAVVEASGISLLELDTGLRCTWVQNPPLGMAPQRLLNRSMVAALAAPDSHALHDALQAALRQTQPTRAELQLTNGDLIGWFDVTFMPMVSERGMEPDGLRCALVDVTERRAERERQRETLELFRVAQDHSLDAFEVLRPVANEGRIVDFRWEYINPAGAALLERPAEALIGRCLLEDPDDAFLAARFRHWAEVMEAGVPRRADFQRHEGKRRRWMNTLSVSLGDRLVASTRDTSALTRGLNAERAARAALQRTARLKDDFLANLSHELRTPLNAVAGWAHLLGRPGAEPALMQKASAAIDRNVRAQTRLVDDLLDMNRIVSGTLELSRRRVDLGEIVRRVTAQLAPTAAAKWISLDVAAVDAEVTCHGDPDRLTQVFWNLVSNAIKYTPLNGKVRVSVGLDGDQARVTVADDGQGIEPELLPRMFDRFEQVESGIARRQGGLGLGLTIVRSLVEMHEGEVEIHSDGPGRGTCVTVRLPLREPDDVDTLVGAGGQQGAEADGNGAHLSAATEATPANADAAVSGDTPSLAWRRILLLEDQADSLELMSVLLREQGAIVRAFDNAEEALSAAEHGSFDLIVSDLGLPGMDGLEFMRRLRRRAVVAPALALTAYAGEPQAREALQAGFTRVEIKPISPPRFLQVVRQEISARRPG